MQTSVEHTARHVNESMVSPLFRAKAHALFVSQPRLKLSASYKCFRTHKETVPPSAATTASSCGSITQNTAPIRKQSTHSDYFESHRGRRAAPLSKLPRPRRSLARSSTVASFGVTSSAYTSSLLSSQLAIPPRQTVGQSVHPASSSVIRELAPQRKSALAALAAVDSDTRAG